MNTREFLTQVLNILSDHEENVEMFLASAVDEEAIESWQKDLQIIREVQAFARSSLTGFPILTVITEEDIAQYSPPETRQADLNRVGEHTAGVFADKDNLRDEIAWFFESQEFFLRTQASEPNNEQALLDGVQTFMQEIGANDVNEIHFGIDERTEADYGEAGNHYVEFIQFVDTIKKVSAVAALSYSNDFDDLAFALLELSDGAGIFSLYKTGKGWSFVKPEA